MKTIELDIDGVAYVLDADLARQEGSLKPRPLFRRRGQYFKDTTNGAVYMLACCGWDSRDGPNAYSVGLIHLGHGTHYSAPVTVCDPDKITEDDWRKYITAGDYKDFVPVKV